MMRFDKSTSNRAAAPQLGDKNGNFGQKNDFSAVDHFFCTLCSLFILDFIFFFNSYPPTPRLLAAQAPKPQKTAVFGARMLMRHTQMTHNRKIEYFRNRV